jgi:hypothetical protein
MGRKKKDNALSIIQKPNIRPEQIVRYLEGNGTLSDDFNPYGNYKPDKIRYRGDTPPDSGDFIVINGDDPDLIPIVLGLPSPPPLKLIDGYGLNPDEQYFKRLPFPDRLKGLYQEVFESLNDVQKKNYQETIQSYKLYLKYWEMLEDNQADFTEEIEYIKHIWWYRIYGYWFYNDGKPTYITGDYFDFLQWWYIAEAAIYPEYRDKDRRKYIFAQYIEECTETFEKVDKDTGAAIKDADGNFKMIDLGRRTFFGDVEPKSRRGGATHQCVHKVWKGNSTTTGAYGTIISMEGRNAEKHYFKKLIPAWDKYPMFLKPIWTGNRRPNAIKMIEPPNVFGMEGLGSMIDFTDSAGVSANDGDRLNYILQDEMGKTAVSDVFERWTVNKIAMSTGGGTNIIKHCYSKNPSTVEEMEEGGMSYYKLCQLSAFYERIPTKGQTYSGLARIFFPAYDGLEGYIDRFGMSVINDPTERQKKLSPHSTFALSGEGAKKTLQDERDALLAKGTPEALEQYRSLRRKHPFNWSECWLGASGNVGFNMEKIDRRIGELNRMKSFGKLPYKIGNFYWENGKRDSRVLWQDDPQNGKFKLSMDLRPDLTNLRIQEVGFDASQGTYVPMWQPISRHKLTIGVDAIRIIGKNDAKVSISGSRQSDFGIAGLYEDESGNQEFILSYRYRPATQEESMEDVIMAMVYLNAMVYQENNVERLFEYIMQRGYANYLIYDVDIRTGRIKDKPGIYTTAESKIAYFAIMKTFVDKFAENAKHDDILQEIKDIRGLEDMTHRDLFTASCLALMGNQSRYRQIIDMSNSMTVDFSGYSLFQKRRY